MYRDRVTSFSAECELYFSNAAMHMNCLFIVEKKAWLVLHTCDRVFKLYNV